MDRFILPKFAWRFTLGRESRLLVFTVSPNEFTDILIKSSLTSASTVPVPVPVPVPNPIPPFSRFINRDNSHFSFVVTWMYRGRAKKTATEWVREWRRERERDREKQREIRRERERERDREIEKWGKGEKEE